MNMIGVVLDVFILLELLGACIAWLDSGIWVLRKHEGSWSEIFGVRQ